MIILKNHNLQPIPCFGSPGGPAPGQTLQRSAGRGFRIGPDRGTLGLLQGPTWGCGTGGMLDDVGRLDLELKTQATERLEGEFDQEPHELVSFVHDYR